MSADTALVRGWCPGALRPMESGDGLIARVRVTGGILAADRARGLAEASARFGSGVLDLSARANLQIRGVSADTLPGLTDALAGLGLLDDDPAAEAVRNVLASPLAGRDPTALLDIRPLVSALEGLLAGTHALHALPGKFGVAVDDGGIASLDGERADIVCRAVATVKGVGMALALDGPAGRAWLRPVPVADTMKAVADLAMGFLALRGADRTIRRMRALVARDGAAAVAAAAGLVLADAPPAQRPRPELVGLGPHGLGVAAPFGRWTAAMLARLADLATAAGHGELRLTPWRAILVPGATADMPGVVSVLADPAAITRPDDPRRAVVACTGAPACPQGLAATHGLALDLASLAAGLPGAWPTLHVSGCAKGCAHPDPVRATLVAQPDGRYALIRDGTASEGRSGEGLDVSAIRGSLAALANGEDETA